MLPSSCLRRSARISNLNPHTINQRRGICLFQERPVDTENGSEVDNINNGLSNMNPGSSDISYHDDGRAVPAKRSKKCETRATSDSINKRKIAKRSRSVISPTVSTPVRGSKATPVTPEPLVVGSSNGSEKPQKKKATKVKRKAKVTRKKASKVVLSWPEPEGWRETYELVRELRTDKTAPCDIMGAEALSLPSADNIDKGSMDDEVYLKRSRFQTLIALMLSSQTKDAMVGQAMGNLRDTSDGSGGLTVASILEMDPKVLNEKIYCVGFRNNKTKYIKEVAQILRDDYDDDVPPTADEMIRLLPGIGPKMAYIIENICWNKQTGIGVDTHMQRLFPKLGWVSSDSKNPEQTRKQLESWLPQKYWGEINLLWVGFGQEVQQERQKLLRKALKSNRRIEALRLLQSVDFDVVNEWKKMLSEDSTRADEEERNDAILFDDIERETITKEIEHIASKK